MTKDIHFERKTMLYKLQQLKKEKGLTYQQIGEGIGVDRSHVYRIMNDPHSSASLNLLVGLARFFEVPFYLLFTPSQAMVELDFVHMIQAALEGRQWSLEELATQAEINPIRLKEFVQGEVQLTSAERVKVTEILELPTVEGLNLDWQLQQVGRMLREMGVAAEKCQRILDYIQEI